MKCMRGAIGAVIGLYITAGSFAQTTVVVNNTPGVTADFSSLQTAVNTVADGTLILLQPGPASYGDVTIKKRLVIIGGGYFLGTNAVPFTQATPSPSVVDRIFFDTLSNGSYITGLSLSGDVTTGSNSRLNFTSTSDITISRCYISRTQHTPLANVAYGINTFNVTMKQCFIESSQSVQVALLDHCTAFFFNNNIFNGSGNKQPVEVITRNTAGVHFTNNTIFNWQNENITPAYCFFQNNIFINDGGGNTPVIAEGGASYNVGNVDYFAGAISNNITTATAAMLFNSSAGSQDANYQLKAGSPASGFAPGGIDAGAFGGLPDDKYVLSGISEFVPNIYFMNVPTVGAHTGGLPVHIKIKANK